MNAADAKSELGALVRAARKAKRLTQKQVAEVLDVDQTAVSGWELGNSSPDVPVIDPLAKLLGLSAKRLHTLKTAALADSRPRSGRGGREQKPEDILISALNGQMQQMSEGDLARLVAFADDILNDDDKEQ